MRRTGKSKTCVWSWEERVLEEAFDGLLRDRTRPTRVQPLGDGVVERIVALTHTYAGRRIAPRKFLMMAKAVGVSVSSVQRVSSAPRSPAACGLGGGRLSNDPKFVDKLRDVVGLYVDPPAHAIVPVGQSKKSQIRALEPHETGSAFGGG